MRARLVAAAAGTLVVAGTALAFSLGSHPVIVGTNGVEPFYRVYSLPAGGRHCQSLPVVPSGATQLLMAVDATSRPPATLKVSIRAGSGPRTRGTAHGLKHGLFGLALNHPTEEAKFGRLCVTNPGPGEIALSGENKSGRPGGPAQGVASVIFFEPHQTTWLSRARTIVRRFGDGQVGVVGTWALLVAAVFALAAWALALWWLVTRPGRNA